MPIFATAGTKLYIGGVLPSQEADFQSSDFTSQTWVPIGETQNLGSFGDTAESIEVSTIAYPRTRRLKGVRSAGTMEVVCALDYADAGQLAAIAAEKTDNDYAFKVEFNDAPSGGTPSQRLFVAMVGGASEQLDTVSNEMRLNLTLWINSNIVSVAAAGP